MIRYYICPSVSSFADTDDSSDSRGRNGTIFIPLYQFRLLMNIQTFIWNFACEMTTTYFLFTSPLASLETIRLLLDEIYHLIESPVN